MEYLPRTTRICVLPAGKPLFSECATSVEIEDDVGGEFVVVRQDTAPGRGSIAINPDEWKAVRKAIDDMVAQCRKPAA